LDLKDVMSSRPGMFGDRRELFMRIGKTAALLAGIMFATQASAAVMPSVAHLSAPIAAGARTGAPIRSGSHFAGVGGGGLIISALAAGVIGGGVYLAVKKDHHPDIISVSP
jgi:hypothetical protein